MKNINNQPNRKPTNLLTYYNARSLNDNFIYRIHKQGIAIIKILEKRNSPEKLKNTIFIIEINKFNDDFSKIVSLLEKYYAAQSNIELKIKQAEEFLKKIDSEDLISKIKSFYRTAWNYDENFTMRSWHPMWDSRPIFYRNTFLLNIDLSYSDKKSNYENIFDAHLFFENYDNYFKNFINVLYNDGEEGEKFIRNKFNTVIEEYKYLKETNEEIKKHLTADIIEEKIIQNDQIQKIEIIFEKYPATIHTAIIALLNFLENQST